MRRFVRRYFWSGNAPADLAEWVAAALGMVAFILWGVGALFLVGSVIILTSFASSFRAHRRPHPSNPEWVPDA